MKHAIAVTQRNPIGIEDAQLTQLCAQGDERATRELLSRAIPRVRKTVRFLSSSEFDREDILQNTLIAIVKSVGSFRAESSLLYWVDRVTVFTAAKALEKTNRREAILSRTWFGAQEVESAEDKIDTSRMKQRLGEILSELNPTNRIPVVLHYMHGYKVDEIAKLCDLKKNTVRGRLRNGMKVVRTKALEDPLLKHWVSRR